MLDKCCNYPEYSKIETPENVPESTIVFAHCKFRLEEDLNDCNLSKESEYSSIVSLHSLDFW